MSGSHGGLDREAGEGWCAGQAATWIDIKRSYMELRPRLRFVNTTFRDVGLYRTPLEALGFRVDERHQARVDGQPLVTLRLDMGPHSVDGWLARLLAREVDAEVVATSAPALLDEQARELVVGGERVSLTPLEHGVLRYLAQRPGKAVARHELIEAVWGYGKEASTSNVVEAVVRTLRQKLGPQREALQTVRGVGYRYRPPGAEATPEGRATASAPGPIRPAPRTPG